MILTDRPPETVKVGGRSYTINTDFRAGIELEQEIVHGGVDAAHLLSLYYPVGIPADVSAAIDTMLWFYRCGDTDTAAAEDRYYRPARKRGYDFDQDADALYASFQAAYGIDLTKADLHWWAFRGLMAGLPVDTPFMQRIYYRTVDTKGMSKEQRRHVLEMRKRYAIKSRPGEVLTLEEHDRRMRDYVDRRFAETLDRNSRVAYTEHTKGHCRQTVSPES